MASQKQLALLSKITGCPVVVGPHKLATVLLSLDEKVLAVRTDDPGVAVALAHAIVGGAEPEPESDAEPDEGKGDGGDPGDDDATDDEPVSEEGSAEGEAESEGSAEGTLTRDDLEQMTKAELQDTAVQLGLPRSGNVKALFKRVTDFLDI